MQKSFPLLIKERDVCFCQGEVCFLTIGNSIVCVYIVALLRRGVALAGMRFDCVSELTQAKNTIFVVMLPRGDGNV